jgi:hypothetical protein
MGTCRSTPRRQVPSSSVTPQAKKHLNHFIVQVHGQDPELTTHLQKEADKMFRDIEQGMSYAEIRARYG